MVYRDEPCEFCPMPAAETCARCGSRVCEETHGCAKTEHCAMCAKELSDDLEEARIMVDIRKPERDGSPFMRPNPVEDWMVELQHLLARRRVMRRFKKRTREAIKAWRTSNGIYRERSRN